MRKEKDVVKKIENHQRLHSINPLSSFLENLKERNHAERIGKILCLPPVLGDSRAVGEKWTADTGAHGHVNARVCETEGVVLTFSHC